MIFAVFDPMPLTVCIKDYKLQFFFTYITYNGIQLRMQIWLDRKMCDADAGRSAAWLGGQCVV